MILYNKYQYLLFLFFNALFCGHAQTPLKEVVHKVQVLHEGLDFDHKQNCDLIELQDSNNQAIGYYMDVESVICLDHKCKVVRVRLYWNPLGFYDRYELAPNVILEKTEGIAFSSADYSKLNSILADTQSSLKEYYRNQSYLRSHGNETLNEIDGVTGATSGIDANSIVKGAAWTSCTLWHWANGEIFEIIRKITASQLTTTTLTQYLTQENEKKRIFVINQLIDRKAYSNEVVAVVLKELGNNPTMIRPLLNYIEHAPATVYFDAIKQLYSLSVPSFRVILLNSLQQSQVLATIPSLDWATQQLAGVASFQELQLLYRLLEKQKPLSDLAKIESIKLLNHSQFLIARASYWFLKNKTVSDEQNKSLEHFRSKNLDRL